MTKVSDTTSSAASSASSRVISSDTERKWQQYWEEKGLHTAPERPKAPTCYVLDMFPYPSGAGLHVGHPLGYIASDIYARYKRMEGYDVLHPMGFDAFGLPAEQYAIETGRHPADTTAENMARYKGQLQRLGLSYDWERTICTASPDFYAWTQWMFGLFFESWYDKTQDRARSINSLPRLLAEHGSDAVAAAKSFGAPTFSAQAWREASSEQKERWLLDFRMTYLDNTYINWCPALATVLSNDEIKEGCSERGGHPVERRLMRQWMLRITPYASRLLEDMEALQWPDAILDMQRHWIGRSEGMEITFEVLNGGEMKALRSFTTRPDTIYGVTYLCVSAEQALLLPVSAEIAEKATAFAKIVHHNNTLSSGFFTGCYAIHPLNRSKLPIWVADYVVAGYGTGALMAVPAHDSRDYAFASTYELPIRRVIEPPAHIEGTYEGAYEGIEGKLIASESLSGRSVKEAQREVLNLLQAHTKVEKCLHFRLRDAVFARQRYWGEPMPIYYEGGLPKQVPDEELPLVPPEISSYLPTEDGKPPLSRAKDWKTPDGHPYEHSTMPGWAASSWYFFRYMDPHNKETFCSKQALNAWKQVDVYVGGSEHAVGHLLYARFWCKFLYDRGFVPVKEFAKKLVNQGMVHGRSFFVYRLKGTNTYISHGLRSKYETTALYVENHLVSEDKWLDIEGFCKSREHRKEAKFVLEEGKYGCGTEMEKMSKSKYNVINPDALLEQYGADTFRMYEMFMGPLEQNKLWDTSSMEGISRFLKKIWRLFHLQEERFYVSEEPPSAEELQILHKTIQKVATDTEKMHFNTAISSMMIAVNGLQAQKCNKRSILEPLLLLLCPYAPHMAEELWHRCGHSDSVTRQRFPSAKSEHLKSDQQLYPISINGKVRSKMLIPTDTSAEAIKSLALEQTAIQSWLKGLSPKKIIVVPGKIVNIVL